MPNMPGKIETRPDLTVFFVLDTSGSMENEKIATLNAAMIETTKALEEEAKHNGDAHIRIAILEFNSGCNWITYNGPEYIEDFIYSNLKAGGVTDIGSALKELESKLHKDQYLNATIGAKLPIIIFMTDGYPTDDYEDALDSIKQNKWFRYATKIGFAIGDAADDKAIADIVGNSEAVIKTDDLDKFKKLLKYVTITSSKLQSQTKNDAGQLVTGGSIVSDAINDGILDDADVSDANVVDDGDIEEDWNLDDWE